MVNLIGATSDDARDIMVEGESGILAICPADERPIYNSHKRRLEWPNGAISRIFTADEPERLRGKQHMKLWCMPGDTLVRTKDGDKRIDLIKINDFVMTRKGLRRVLGHELTQKNAEIFQLETMDGQIVRSTGNHPVWVEGKGFLPMSDLREGMKVCVINAFVGAEKSGIGTMMATMSHLFACIAKSGKRLTAKFHLAITFTTLMVIKKTIISTILNSSLIRSIAPNISKIRLLLKLEKSPIKMLWRKDERTQNSVEKENLFAKYVAVFIQAVHGILPHIVPNHALIMRDQADLKEKIGFALIVRRYTKLQKEFKNTVQKIACATLLLDEKKSQGKLFVRAEKTLQVGVAMRDSVHASVPAISMTTIVTVKKLPILLDVFDIAVEEAAEFFANGILVHNCDEICSWRYEEAWTQAMFGLRLGRNPQAVITTTPKPIKVLKEIISDQSTIITAGSTYDNRDNLAQSFFSKIITKYEGTRIGRQELKAELLEDIPGALWRRSDIDATRVRSAPPLLRIVIAIDPAASSQEGSDETGIVAAGKGIDGFWYILEDKSGIYSPDEWAKVAIDLYHTLKADRIIGEANNGGEMIEAVLRNIDRNVSYKSVHATKGKVIRAEPVAALYEQRRVRHVGAFGMLEDQMCMFSSDYDRKKAKYSPDRMDALVWAMTELAVEQAPGDNIVEYLEQQAKKNEALEAEKKKLAVEAPKNVIASQCDFEAHRAIVR